MNTKCNTPKVLCLGILLIAVITAAISLLVGCETLSREATRREIAAALQVAYDAGGKVAVSNRIEQLVAEGKLKPENAAILHALAERAFEDVVNALVPTNTAALVAGNPTAASAANAAAQRDGGNGVGGEAVGDSGVASGGDAGTGAGDAESARDAGAPANGISEPSDDGGEDDAYCGECDACRAADAE